MNIRHTYQSSVQKWKQLRGNTILRWCHRITLLGIVAGLVFFLWKETQLPPQVPLWYTKPWGEEQLAHKYFLLLLPLGSMLWYSITVGMGIFLLDEFLTFTQLLFLSSTIVSIGSLIALIKIILIVS